MTTEWIYRILLIVPDSEKETLQALWTIIAPGGDGEAKTFYVPLSATGNDPATHWGAATAATEIMKTLIANIFTDELSNSAVSVDPYTEDNWNAFLVTNGLLKIEKELF